MQPMRSTPVLFIALALAATACSSASDETTSAPDGTASDVQAEDADAGEAGQGFVVATASTEYGDIIVDADGMALYIFDPDAQGPSTCEDACAQAWPPAVTSNGTVTGPDDLDVSLLGTTTRNDGSTQVTYDGWPLYYWASDSSPGDITGFGVQDVWWVITGTGDVVRGGDNPSDDAESGDTGSGGYDYSY